MGKNCAFDLEFGPQRLTSGTLFFHTDLWLGNKMYVIYISGKQLCKVPGGHYGSK